MNIQINPNLQTKPGAYARTAGGGSATIWAAAAAVEEPPKATSGAKSTPDQIAAAARLIAAMAQIQARTAPRAGQSRR